MIETFLWLLPLACLAIGLLLFALALVTVVAGNAGWL